MADEYRMIGTTSPIFIPRLSVARSVVPDESYFLVKVRSAQVAFSGPLWERAKQLIVTSQIALNHPLLGPEPIHAIQRAYAVQPGRAIRLGLGTNLINLTPAMMDRVSFSIEFLIDRENRLAQFAGLINDDAFLSAISLATGAAAAARAVGAVAQGVLRTLLPTEDRRPVLQFGGDFNLAADELRDGYYVILGSQDQRVPIPRPLPKLKIDNGELLADDQPVTRWSYVVLEVRSLEARTRALCEGARWEEKLREAEAIAQRMIMGHIAEGELRRDWEACLLALKDAQVLLLEDPNYLRREAQQIIRSSYIQCKDEVLSALTTRRGNLTTRDPSALPRWFDPQADRRLLRLTSDVDQEEEIRRYKEQVEETERVLRLES